MKVGLTGHQNIGSKSDIDWVKNQLEKQIEKYKVTNGLSCLAAGADQLYAQLLDEKNIALTAIIPSDGYEKTFDQLDDLFNYKSLLLAAKEKIKLNFSSPTEEAFYAAGKEVVERSDMIFAVWNGKKAKGLGGTADIVDFAKQQKKRVIHINPVNRTISKMNFYNDKETIG